jgi:hypothetical protein
MLGDRAERFEAHRNPSKRLQYILDLNSSNFKKKFTL